MAGRARRDPAAFIQQHLRVTETPGLPGLRLYTAHPGSGLALLARAGAPPPYWAYRWPGGLALAHHVAAHPAIVRGRRALDFGAGSGLVAIAAAQAGAAAVLAAEIDPYGRAAIGLNAALNGVAMTVLDGDEAVAPPAVDLVLAGDVFYDAGVARRALPFLERCRAEGIDVLIGDPGRADLPLERLERVASYALADPGAAAGVVYRLTGKLTVVRPSRRARVAPSSG